MKSKDMFNLVLYLLEIIYQWIISNAEGVIFQAFT